MREIEVKQGNIYEVSLKENFSIIDRGFGPCIILMYIDTTDENNKKLFYAHFDEEDKKEFNSFFKEFKKKKISKILILGGRESELINHVIKSFKRNRTSIYSESIFDFSPITAITINNQTIVVSNQNYKKEVSTNLLYQLFF